MQQLTNELNQTQDGQCSGLTEHSRPSADILCRSFVAAHLLIGNSAQAESAVMLAIDSWNPDDERPEELFQLTLKTAAQMPYPSGVDKPNAASSSYLSIELRHILTLPFELRRCFVLRVLAGLPSQICAEILHMKASQINQQLTAAMKYLSAIDSERE